MSSQPRPPLPQPASAATVSEPTPESLQVKPQESGDKSDFVQLNSGAELSETAAVALAASRPVHWVVLAGPIDAGKTTLLASVYELLQWKPMGDISFAGSNTLPAFEERCFLSRRSSGNETPETERTPYKGPDPKYLHLRIRSANGLRSFVDFLFTDVSGELFEHARNSTAECKEMVFLKRASNLVVLLDSEKAVQKNKRWTIVEEARGLLNSCLDSGMLSNKCVVTILWSRFDYFAADASDDGHRAFRDEVERELRTSFGRRIASLNFGELAARPLKAPDLKDAYGVPALFKQWVATALAQESPDLLPTSFAGTRESELFAERHFESIKDDDERSSE